MALCWLLATSVLHAEAPLDLESPFLKTALIQEKSGEISEKTVRKGRENADLLELQREEGGLLVLPRSQVIGILPRLPTNGMPYLQSDAQRALRVLEKAQTLFPDRAEVSPSAIAEWRKLSSTQTEEDDSESASLDDWIRKSSRLSSDTQLEVLEAMQQEGVAYLGKFPARAKEIERELKGLRELGTIDLERIDSIQFEFGTFGENFLIGAGLWVLLIVPILVVLKAFPDAVSGFRQGLPVAGFVRVLIGGLALIFLFMFMTGSPEGMNLSPVRGEPATVVARKAGWFSLNHRERWANQTAKKFSLPATDWLIFLGEKIGVGAGADSFPFWHLARPGIYRTTSHLVVFQPVQAKFISIPFCFLFQLPRSGQSVVNLELAGASVGRIPLGASLGKLAWNLFQTSYQPLAEKCGLLQGVRWLAGEGMTVVIEIPQTKKPTPVARDSLSAKDLAEVFDQGYGEIYLGRVITVEGALISVSSRRETLGAGTGLAVADPIDEFVLQGIPEGPSHRFGLQVRCQFKSNDTYSLDTKGDLFVSKNAKATDTYSLGANGDLPKPKDTPQVPFAGIPVLRRQQGITLVRMSAGRVESGPDEKRAVTLYDCRKVEGYEGGAWKMIWESEIQPGQ